MNYQTPCLFCSLPPYQLNLISLRPDLIVDVPSVSFYYSMEFNGFFFSYCNAATDFRIALLAFNPPFRARKNGTLN